jgi:hypothetical protein
MKTATRLVSIVAFGLWLTACTATVGAGAAVSIPGDSATTCGEHCTSIGMSLDAVVIMANNVGCVCRSAKAPSTPGASGATGGMAALVVEEQQRTAAQVGHR